MDFLSNSEIELLSNFYDRLSVRYNDKGPQVSKFSPNTPHYKFLIDQIVQVLIDNNIVEENEILVANSENKFEVLNRIKISEILDSFSPKHYESKLKSLKNSDNSFDINERTLLRYYADVWSYIDKRSEQGLIDKTNQETAINSLEIIFGRQYRFYGFIEGDVLLQSSKIEINKIIKILNRAGLPISDLGSYCNYIQRPSVNDYNGLLVASKNRAPSLRVIRELRDNTIIALEQDIRISDGEYKQDLIKKVGSVYNALIWRIKQNNKYIDIFKGVANTMKLRLILTIVNSHDVLLGIEKIHEVSALLFNDPRALGNFFANPGSVLNNLLRMKYCIDHWHPQDFDYNIDGFDLGKLRQKCIDIIDKYILNDASGLIYKGSDKDKQWSKFKDSFFEDKFIVTSTYWKAWASYSETSQSTFKDLSEESSGLQELTNYLGKTWYDLKIGKKKLLGMLLSVEMMEQVAISEMRSTKSWENTFDKIIAYEEALQSILEYTGLYHLKLSRSEMEKLSLSESYAIVRDFLINPSPKTLISNWLSKLYVNYELTKSISGRGKLKDHMVLVDLLRYNIGGFPQAIVDVYSDATKISDFFGRLTGFGDNVLKKKKDEEIKTIIRKNKIDIYYSGRPENTPEFIQDLIRCSQDDHYFELKGASNSPSHEDLAYLLKNVIDFNFNHLIGSEVPVWIYIGGNIYAGHIDFLIYNTEDNTIYVVDYKPNLTPTLGYEVANTNFFNAIPQVGVYGLTIQKQCNIKVKCVIFNKEGAWVFDPNGILNSIDNFMNKYGTFIPPWEDFSNMQ
jgi:hypothetical protein